MCVFLCNLNIIWLVMHCAVLVWLWTELNKIIVCLICVEPRLFVRSFAWLSWPMNHLEEHRTDRRQKKQTASKHKLTYLPPKCKEKSVWKMPIHFILMAIISECGIEFHPLVFAYGNSVEYYYVDYIVLPSSSLPNAEIWCAFSFFYELLMCAYTNMLSDQVGRSRRW